MNECAAAGAVPSLPQSRQVCDERRHPSLAAVIRVGLLEMVGIRRDVRPDASHEDGPAIDCLLGE
jgi:hypothetical protein